VPSAIKIVSQAKQGGLHKQAIDFKIEGTWEELH
jgi:hypothetical protein